MTYHEFLTNKIAVAPATGFSITVDDVNPNLKLHVRDAVVWAIAGGRRAIFAQFGLGKTAMELEFCRIVTERMGGKALIVLPLGVKQEFTRDALRLLGWKEAPPYIRTMDEARACGHSIMLTNYERVRDGDIDPSYFSATCLDEAAVLRSFGSKTYQEFLPKFAGVKYKLVCTAVPSPNRYKELIHYSGYLEVMDTGQALTRFFQRDSQKANNLTIYPHMEEQFWLWISSWALFLTKPSDLGYSDEGYDLPPLEIIYHKIAGNGEITVDRDGQAKLYREVTTSLPDAAQEKNRSIAARVDVARQIVEESPGEHFILWHDLEEERHALKKAVPEVVEVFGSLDLDEREKRIIDFSEGRSRILATKKSLSGSGCNFQHHCHNSIFVGIDQKFHDFIQAIHRTYRFLQRERVKVHIIYSEAESEILRNLKEKWRRHDEMAEKMREIIKKYGLVSQAMQALTRKMGVERVEVKGEYYTAVNNDCVDELARMPDDSMDMWLTSIPFGNHYEYANSYNDFGHNQDTEAFFEQMDYLTPHLLRTLRPGRIYACHVKDRILFGGVTGDGFPTCEAFPEQVVMHYMRHGFRYMGKITVVTDVVRENKQTNRLGWSEQCKDGTKMGVGCPEYILIFRKVQTDTGRGYADLPVRKLKEEYTRAQWQIDAHAHWPSSGDRLLAKDELMAMPVGKLQAAFRKYSRGKVYDYHEHVEIAKELDEGGRLPAAYMVVAPISRSFEVWDDILRMRTLNTTQSQRRQNLHVCPLQLDIVERLINRYSNPGELIGDPFAGLMTVPYMAVRMERRGWGCELNPDYFRDGVGYIEEAEAKRNVPTLFDFMGMEGAVDKWNAG